MRVLAIDTALAACAAVVLDTGHGIVASESLPMLRGHAEALLPLIARVMKQSETNFRDLDRIAVTIGPGSFTGVRVGLAAACGFGVATGVPVVGVSTLSVYAAPYLAANSKSSVIAAIDARHDHVFLQVFGPGGGTLISPRLARLSEANAQMAKKHPNDATMMGGFLFFRYLQNEKTDLLDFHASDNDKWQIVYGWLRDWVKD
jgi:tRNA threonylcarbamoyladenosine biosynthesis protein TsaB